MRSREENIIQLRILGFVVSANRSRLLLFILAALAAFYLGFVAFDIDQLRSFIQKGGYYFISVLFVLFLSQAVLVWKRSESTGREGLGWRLWLWVGGCSLLLWGGDLVRHKLLFDEFVLQATSLSMHLDKYVACPVRAHWIQGTFTLMDGYLDKRPYFFSYIVSLVHDLTGYRDGNVFVVNALLVPVFLVLVARISMYYAGRRAAFIAVGLLGTLPILAQVCTSGAMEMLNLTMLAVVLHASILYVRQASSERLGYLCISVVLLSQCRYESIIYVSVVALVIVISWLRMGRADVTNLLIVTPLFFVPAVWQNRFVDASPALWELKEGNVSRFSSDYLKVNWEGMWNFYSSTHGILPNSFMLGVLGVLAVLFLSAGIFRRLLAGKQIAFGFWPLGLVCAATLALMVLFLFYYWARLDDVPACRFSLPCYLVLALLVGLAVVRAGTERPWLLRVFWGLWLLNLSIFYFPSTSNRIFTLSNTVSSEVEWEVEYVNSLPKVPRLMVGHNVLPWLVNQYSCVGMERARHRSEQIEFHVREGTFHEVLYVQLLTPSSIAGEFTVINVELPPVGWKLQTLATKRFGARIVRISRVIFDKPADPVQ